MVMVIFSHGIFLRVKICMVFFFFPSDSQGSLELLLIFYVQLKI